MVENTTVKFFVNADGSCGHKREKTKAEKVIKLTARVKKLAVKTKIRCMYNSDFSKEKVLF